MNPLLFLDQLEAGSKLMANAGSALRIKYGLANDPSESKILEWARQTRTYQQRGFGLEQAGDVAAKLLFPDYRSRYYASEADTIEALLRAAEGK
jgi:hypothetical protein